MRRYTLILMLLGGLFQLDTAHAQSDLQRKGISEDISSTWTIELPGLDDRQVSKLWTAFVREHYDARPRYDRKRRQYVAQEVNAPSIARGSNLTFITTLDEGSNSTGMTLRIVTEGEEVSSYDSYDRRQEVSSMLDRFREEARKEKVRGEIAEEEKKLRELEKDLRKLQSEQDRYERDIERARETIRKAEAAIVRNASDQEAAEAAIEEQRRQVEKTRERINRPRGSRRK